MSRVIRKRPRAQKDLDDLAYYIAQDNPSAGFRFYEAAEKAFRQLLDMPGMGGTWASPNPRLVGLRVWPIRGFENHLVFYRPNEEGIEIVRVLHGFRDLDRILESEG